MEMIDTLSRPFAALGEFATGFAVATTTRLSSTSMAYTKNQWWGLDALLGRTAINYRLEGGDPTRNSIVVAVVGWIARNFPEAPVRIRRMAEDGSSETIRPGFSGPGAMLRLLERPNPYFSGVLQWIATITDLFTRGDAYWVKMRNEADRVVELWWVPWWMMAPYWDPTPRPSFIDYYVYTVDGIRYRIETRDVVHFRDGIDPLNTRRGLSKLASLFREIFTDDEAANFTAVLLKNFAVPGVVIAPANTGGVLGKVDPESVKRKFMDTFGGDNRGGVLALSSPTDVKVLSWSPDQMKLRELRRIPEERISAVLGVSAIVAGLGAGLDRSTFTNFGEARRAAYQEAISPLQRLIAADLEVQLLRDFADIDVDPLDVDFDTSKASALQEALDAVWKRNESSATKGLLTRAEFRQAVGAPVTTDDDVYIIPNNYTVMEPGGLTPPGSTTPPPQIAPPPSMPPDMPPPRRGEAVRCSGCDRLLAEQATAPYRFTCSRCKVVTEADGLVGIVEMQVDPFVALSEAFTTLATRELPAPSVTFAEGAFQFTGGETHIDEGAIQVHASPVVIEEGAVQVTTAAPAATHKRVVRNDQNQITEIVEESD